MPEDMKFNERLHLQVRRGHISSSDNKAVNQPKVKLANTTQEAQAMSYVMLS